MTEEKINALAEAAREALKYNHQWFVGKSDLHRALIAFDAHRLHKPAHLHPVAGEETDAIVRAEPFVVRHYVGEDRPIVKGNRFDGLEIGSTREDSIEFINFINDRIAVGGRYTAPQRSARLPPVAGEETPYAASPVNSWEWLRGVMDGLPTREEQLGGQRTLYVQKDEVMGWIAEGLERYAIFADRRPQLPKDMQKVLEGLELVKLNIPALGSNEPIGDLERLHYVLDAVIKTALHPVASGDSMEDLEMRP
jgi:hypothetical protein